MPKTSSQGPCTVDKNGLALFRFELERANDASAKWAADAALRELGLLDQRDCTVVAALVVAAAYQQLRLPAGRSWLVCKVVQAQCGSLMHSKMNYSSRTAFSFQIAIKRTVRKATVPHLSRHTPHSE